MWRSPWETRGSGVFSYLLAWCRQMCSCRHIPAGVRLMARLILSFTSLWKRWSSIESAVSAMLRSRHAAGEAFLSRGFADLCVFLPADPRLRPLWREVVTSPLKYVCHRATGPSWLILETHWCMTPPDTVALSGQTCRRHRIGFRRRRMSLIWLWNQPRYRISSEDAFSCDD